MATATAGPTDMSTLTTKTATGAGAPPQIAEATRLYGLIAEFKTPGEAMAAAEKVRDAGYRWWDTCTPFPVHGMDRAMGIRRTILPVIVFFAGMSGTLAAFILQWFTMGTETPIWALVWVTGYPYLISGKPLMSLPAFIPVMFEVTILFAALTTVFGMFIMNGLPRLHHPLFKSDRFLRVTNDRFFVVIEARDPKFIRGKTESFLRSLNPISIEAVDE